MFHQVLELCELFLHNVSYTHNSLNDKIKYDTRTTKNLYKKKKQEQTHSLKTKIFNKLPFIPTTQTLKEFKIMVC